MHPTTNLLILHGWNHSAQMWQNASQYLDPAKIHLFTPDLPGFGTEPLISPTWHIPDYAAWVQDYIQKHILTENRQPKTDNSLVLLGHSFGGRIAAYLASQNPPWLNQLILYAAPTLYRPTPSTKLKIQLYKSLKKIIGEHAAKKLIKLINPELSHADQTGLGQIYRHTIPFDQTEYLKKILVPTHIIQGTADDQFNPHLATETSHLIPNSTLHLLQHQSHNPHLDNPTLFYGLSRKILEENN